MTYAPPDHLHKQFNLKTTMRPTAVFVQGTQSSVQPNSFGFTHPRCQAIRFPSEYNPLPIVKVQLFLALCRPPLLGISLWSSIATGEKPMLKTILDFA